MPEDISYGSESDITMSTNYGTFRVISGTTENVCALLRGKNLKRVHLVYDGTILVATEVL